jgi:hypothetical protein
MNSHGILQHTRILGLLLCGLFCDDGSAADFTIAPIGAFGEELTQCRVDSFRLSGTKSRIRGEYKDSFHGLVANDLPNGKYEVVIRCREARIDTTVNVSELHRFEVVSENRRFLRSDHVIPQLVIRITGSQPRHEMWWITLRALYDERLYTSEFRSKAAEARVLDPEPGSYLVSVLSAAGYDCTREIDLVESTRLWTFDPAACAFNLDEFANLVTDEDRHSLKGTGWYQQLRKNDEDLFRALGGASKADGSNKK